MFTPSELAEQGIVQLQTPWHFPLQRSNKLGDVAMEDHALRAAECGVDDHGSWKTYASLLPLAHWQTVLAGRYPDAMLAKAFNSRLDAVLAPILGLTEERVKKLRFRLSALREGRRTSLRCER